MIHQDRLALLADSRIPADARIMGLAIMEAGGEWIEVPHNTFRALLGGGPSDETIRRHLRSLEGVGWIESKHGGRGHSPLYRATITPHGCAPKDPWRTLLAQTVENFSPAGDVGPSSDTPTPDVGLKPTVGREIESKVDNPPVVPPVTEKLIEEHAEVLAGCRGALRDYLAAKVPPGRQRSFVGTVVQFLEGGDPTVWRQPDGSRLPAGEWPATMALALNELGATDEATRKHKPGDPRNLRNKIHGLISDRHRKTQRGANGHRRTEKATGSEASRPGSELGLGGNQGSITFETDPDDDAAAA